MSNEPSKKNMFGSWGMAKDKKAEAPTGDGAGGTTWLRKSLATTTAASSSMFAGLSGMVEGAKSLTDRIKRRDEAGTPDQARTSGGHAAPDPRSSPSLARVSGQPGAPSQHAAPATPPRPAAAHDPRHPGDHSGASPLSRGSAAPAHADPAAYWRPDPGDLLSATAAEPHAHESHSHDATPQHAAAVEAVPAADLMDFGTFADGGAPELAPASSHAADSSDPFGGAAGSSLQGSSDPAPALQHHTSTQPSVVPGPAGQDDLMDFGAFVTDASPKEAPGAAAVTQEPPSHADTDGAVGGQGGQGTHEPQAQDGPTSREVHEAIEVSKPHDAPKASDKAHAPESATPTVPVATGGVPRAATAGPAPDRPGQAGPVAHLATQPQPGPAGGPSSQQPAPAGKAAAGRAAAPTAAEGGKDAPAASRGIGVNLGMSMGMGMFRRGEHKPQGSVGSAAALEGADGGRAAELEAELSRVRGELERAKDEARKAEGRFEAMRRERDELADNLQGMAGAADERDDLRMRIAALEADAAAAGMGGNVGAASSQIHALETARDAAQAELAAAQEAITALETRLRVAEKEATKAARALEDERRKSAKARAAFLEELDQLLNAGDSGNRSLWPRTVRRLVERVEEAAEAEAQGRVAEAQDAVEAQMSRRVEEAEGRARAAEGRAAERAREVEALRARLGVIERELAAREEAMVQRMEEMRGALEARLLRAGAVAEAESERLRQELANAQEDAEEHRERLDRLREDLASVRWRARSMMDQKDRHIERLEGLLRSHGVRVPAPPPEAAVVPRASTQADPHGTPPEMPEHSRKEPPSPSNSSKSMLSTIAGGLRGAAAASAPASESASELDKARKQVAALQAQLRQEHQRNAHGLDATYLRAILVQGLTTGVIPPSTTLLPVLAEVLRLSQEEEDRIQKRAHVEATTEVALPGIMVTLTGARHAERTGSLARSSRDGQGPVGGGGIA